MLLSAAAVIAGLIAGMAVMMIIEISGAMIYGAIDPNDPDLAAKIKNLPTGAFLSVLAAWAAAPFIGSAIAVMIRRQPEIWPALVIGGLFQMGGVFMLTQMPHPLWFAIVGMLIFIPAAVAGRALACRLNRWEPSANQHSGK